MKKDFRIARQFIWANPDDCFPPHGLDMTSAHDADKVNHLYKTFLDNGFDLTQPALVGYPLNGKIQLLSGTHRHLAASKAGIDLPITLWLRSDVERMWGTPLWENVLEDIPVLELQEAKVKEGFDIPPYEPVILD